MPGTDLARHGTSWRAGIEQPRRRAYRVQVVYSKVIDPVAEPPAADQADFEVSVPGTWRTYLPHTCPCR